MGSGRAPPATGGSTRPMPSPPHDRPRPASGCCFPGRRGFFSAAASGRPSGTGAYRLRRCLHTSPPICRATSNDDLAAAALLRHGAVVRREQPLARAPLARPPQPAAAGASAAPAAADAPPPRPSTPPPPSTHHAVPPSHDAATIAALCNCGSPPNATAGASVCAVVDARSRRALALRDCVVAPRFVARPRSATDSGGGGGRERGVARDLMGGAEREELLIARGRGRERGGGNHTYATIKQGRESGEGAHGGKGRRRTRERRDVCCKQYLCRGEEYHSCLRNNSKYCTIYNKYQLSLISYYMLMQI